MLTKSPFLEGIVITREIFSFLTPERTQLKVFLSMEQSVSGTILIWVNPSHYAAATK